MNAIERLTLEWIGESTTAPDVYTDDATGMAPIRDSINHAIQELCLLTRSFVRTFHLPMLTDRSIYRIVPRRDFWGYPLEVWDRGNHRKLTQTSLAVLAAHDRRFLWRSGTRPSEYFPLGLSALGIFPKPSASGSVLEIRAVMVPKAYTADTDPIHLRDAYQRAAAWYAVSEFCAGRGDAKRASEAWAQYVEVAGLQFMAPGQADRLFMMGAPPDWRRRE